MSYTCIVTDDNLIERDMLAAMLEKIPAVSLLAACSSALEVMELLRSRRADVIFSDIDMPDISGLELLKSLPQPPAFVFITSFSDYAAESYELDAVDYIVKPVTLPRLTRAVNKAIEYLDARQQATGQTPAGDLPAPGKDNDSFYFRDTRGYTRLLYDQVMAVEGMGDFCKIITTGGKTHIVLVNMKNIEPQLPEDRFIRIHKQAIVNIRHIHMITPDAIEMIAGYKTAYSPTYKQKLLDRTVNLKLITRFS
ncbi:MAG: LytTR family DNA-binding domain-containing protein [Chitinophagaceae bacterium]